MPLDAVMRLTSGGRGPFDRDDLYAARGKVDPALLQHLLAHPFLQHAPPRATGGEESSNTFAAALLAAYLVMPRDGLLATLAAFTAEAVTTGLRRWFPTGEVPQEVLMSGRGMHNRALMEALARALAPIPLRTIAAVGGRPDAKEALAFAVLGYLTLRGRAGNLPAVTGARHPVLLGNITPGRLGHDLLATRGTRSESQPSRVHPSITAGAVD
jgi:anhydro-N-acetylmuramic acid kinase